MSTSATEKSRITINSDMGEDVGIHSFGNDEGLLALVDTVNVACGMHAGDPGTMRKAVESAVAAGVTVGAHPGLPDLVGFGRRAMAIEPDEARDLIRYQVAALVGFLDATSAPLDHIKAHGALYSMMARDEQLMDALCDVAVQYSVPIYGLSGTAHETVARRRGVPFVAEFYIDLDYNDDGTIQVNRRPSRLDAEGIPRRLDQALSDKSVTTNTGKRLSVQVDTFCIHSDLSDAVRIAAAVRAALHPAAA